MRPDISVIIPFYDGGRWLPGALDSVLSQEGAAAEVIVVDDGSNAPPDAPLRARYPGVRFTAIAHSGKGAAINAGAAFVGADHLCVLDQDDRMLPGRLAAQLAALKGDSQADAVYSDYERREEDGRLIDRFVSRQAGPAELLHAMARARGLFSLQTLTMRKGVFDRLGGFSPDPRLTGLDDAEFFVRLLASGARLRYVPGLFGSWTSHRSNYSKGAGFHDARLALLERLGELAREAPLLRAELPAFSFSGRYMRGVFLLEEGRPREAAPEFRSALGHRFSWNALYLLFKAGALSRLHPR